MLSADETDISSRCGLYNVFGCLIELTLTHVYPEVTIIFNNCLSLHTIHSTI